MCMVMNVDFLYGQVYILLYVVPSFLEILRELTPTFNKLITIRDCVQLVNNTFKHTVGCY
jgi:hypothetical protein